MNKVYLSLGSNEGDRMRWLSEAIELLGSKGQITEQSSVYETAAWGREEQPNFLNMAAGMHTSLTPDALLEAIQQIEQGLGRVRTEKWGARTLDIDILFFNDLVLSTPILSIPHPLLQERRFVLVPLAEIAPAFVHPISGLTVSELLATCTDRQEVRPIPAD